MGHLIALDDARQAGARRPKRLLVADSDAEAGRVLVEMLCALGYRALWCGTGDAATAICATEPLDGVLTELGLTLSDGTPLLAALQADYPELPIGVVTGWLDHPDRRNGLLAGIPVVANKPLRLPELRLAAERALRSAGER